MEMIKLTTAGNADLKIPAGEEVEVPVTGCGVAEGYGRVVNGWAEGLEYFDKYDDGDTVVAATSDEQGALPIADAYWLLHYTYDMDTADMEAYSVREEYDSLSDVERRYADRPRVVEMVKALLNG